MPRKYELHLYAYESDNKTHLTKCCFFPSLCAFRLLAGAILLLCHNQPKNLASSSFFRFFSHSSVVHNKHNPNWIFSVFPIRAYSKCYIFMAYSLYYNLFSFSVLYTHSLSSMIFSSLCDHYESFFFELFPEISFTTKYTRSTNLHTFRS